MLISLEANWADSLYLGLLEASRLIGIIGIIGFVSNSDKVQALVIE